MATEPEFMRELHAIRERIHEETKHMTPEEQAAHTRKEVEEGLARLGVTLKHVVESKEAAAAQ